MVLWCREEAIIDIFERNTNSVANVFDVTLQVSLLDKLSTIAHIYTDR